MFFFNFLLILSLVFADPIEEFATGSRLFTGDVYNQLLIDNDKNFLISPFSAETVLALTQSGAVGATGEEIRTSLHLPDTKEETELSIKTVLPTIHSDYITLVTANKIYVENNFVIKEDFKRVANDVYQAQFQNIEFQESEAAAEEINGSKTTLQIKSTSSSNLTILMVPPKLC